MSSPVNLNDASLSGEEFFSERSDIDFLDVLRKRVDNGQPIIVHLPETLSSDTAVNLSLKIISANAAKVFNLKESTHD